MTTTPQTDPPTGEPATTAFPKQPHLSRYLDFMHEIKRRDHVADMVYREPQRVLFKPVVVDTCYLQFRKILELIAFSTLSANTPELRKLNQGKDRDYAADRILKRIERKFGSVYPRPIYEKDPKNGDPIDLSPRKEDFLTRQDFSTLYGQCGNILHSRNPYRNHINIDQYYNDIPYWMKLIRNLLNKHIATIVNDSNLYLIQMSGPTFEGRPTLTMFTLLTEND